MTNFGKEKEPAAPIGPVIAKVVGILFCLLGAGGAGFYVWCDYHRPAEPYYEAPVLAQPADPAEMEEQPALLEEIVSYPAGEWIMTDERATYHDGALWVAIPRLDIELPVSAGVDGETLAAGPGLFREAQLPGPSPLKNSNVSIAGLPNSEERGGDGLDALLPGDAVYLSYQGMLYHYEVEELIQTHSQDWEPIRVREYPCVTLQANGPASSKYERLYVVGFLQDAVDGMDEWPVLSGQKNAGQSSDPQGDAGQELF